MPKSHAQMVVAYPTSKYRRQRVQHLQHPCMGGVAFLGALGLASHVSFVLRKLLSLLLIRPVDCPNHIPSCNFLPLRFLHEY
jgi:hypothetical protein